MRLNWTYNPETRTATTVIDESLSYQTSDGGQSIKKFVDGELVKTFWKYGPKNVFMTKAENGWHIPDNRRDTWTGEIVWLSKRYTDIVGKVYDKWTEGIRNREGNLIMVGEDCGGYGVTDPEEKMSVCRLAAPADYSEWWDYDPIAYSKDYNEEDTYGEGVVWRQHHVTKEIVRVGTNQGPMPNCVYPMIHGPYVVNRADIVKKRGIMT